MTHSHLLTCAPWGRQGMMDVMHSQQLTCTGQRLSSFQVIAILPREGAVRPLALGLPRALSPAAAAHGWLSLHRGAHDRTCLQRTAIVPLSALLHDA